MASVKQINLNGTVYDIEDESARTTASQASTTASQAKTTAETALDGAYDIKYASNVIKFTKKSVE